jgi:lipoate-protein ligase A
MGQWFLLLEKEPLGAAENMARDEYLFRHCHTHKAGFFRLYSWEQPTFSIGVSQKIDKVLNLDYIEEHGCAYVRRITGGKTVLHLDEITYAVVSSEDTFYIEHDLYRSYKLISQILVTAFQRLGVAAALSPGSSAALSRSSNPCFSFPTPNEIEIDGKKIVGSAQKRDNRALLQHGSIPVSMDYHLYAEGSRSRPDIIKRRMTTLGDVSQHTRSELIDSLIASFQSFLGESLKEFDFAAIEKEEIHEIEKKYQSREWNFNL